MRCDEMRSDDLRWDTKERIGGEIYVNRQNKGEVEGYKNNIKYWCSGK